jgi:hypothetical protein
VPRDVRAIASPSRQALNPPLFSSCRVRQGRERRANVIDDALDKIEIVAFAHDPDDWFGARRADRRTPARVHGIGRHFDRAMRILSRKPSFWLRVCFKRFPRRDR